MVSDVASAVIRLNQPGSQTYQIGVKQQPVTTFTGAKVCLKSAQVAFTVRRVGSVLTVVVGLADVTLFLRLFLTVCGDYVTAPPLWRTFINSMRK